MGSFSKRLKLALAATLGFVLTLAFVGPASAQVGDGTYQAPAFEDVTDALPAIQDQGFENVTVILTIFAALVAFGFAITVLAIGVRKALAKLKMLVRSA